MGARVTFYAIEKYIPEDDDKRRLEPQERKVQEALRIS
jgi:hypothetical protein